MQENKLLDESIADIKMLKEMAAEMAKNSIAESLTPAIQSLLSQKLAEDFSEEEEEEEEEEIPAKKAPEVPEAYEEGKEEGGMEEALIAKLKEAGLDEATLDAVTKALAEKKEPHAEPDADGPSVDDNKKGTDESFDLDEILAEMEAEPKENKAEDKDKAKDKDEVDESLDIDALLSEIAAEEGEDDMAKEGASCYDNGEDKAKTEAKLAELQTQLQESNLLMAKLLFQNKLLSKGSLSEAQHVKIVKAFDKAKTVNEVKLLFEAFDTAASVAPVAKTTTVAESLGFGKQKQNNKAAEEQKTVLSEQAIIFQRRAGILK